MNTLISKQGMYLTQVAEASDRVFAVSITGIMATLEYWRDATVEEKTTYEENNKVDTDVPLSV